MKTIRFYFLALLFLFSFTQVTAQEFSEEYAGGIPLSAIESAAVPVLQLSSQSAATPLPDSAHNNWRIYFPPVYNQRLAGCCVQASEIGHTFTYEMNRLRNVAAGSTWDTAYSNPQFHYNLYHPHFSYNFLNGGDYHNGTPTTSGYKIAKDNGIPMLYHYNDSVLHGPLYGPNAAEATHLKSIYWATGYEMYYEGMKNRVEEFYRIPLNNLSNLNLLKHWLADHNEGSAIGGVAVFATTGSFSFNSFPTGFPYVGRYVKEWRSSQSAHQMTIVGYDNNIAFDLDGDGILGSNSSEYGGFKVANSYGNESNNAFFWVPYVLMVNLPYDPNAYVAYVKNYNPELTLKACVSHPKRNKLKFSVGYGGNALATQPIAGSEKDFEIFNYQGGENDMRGCYDGSLEFGYDVGSKIPPSNIGKLFLRATEKQSTTSDTIHYFSLIDYRWGEVFELYCNNRDVVIPNTGLLLSIEYDLLEHEEPIYKTVTYTTNKVSRFNPRIEDTQNIGLEVGFGTGIRVDMYNSEITIEAGATLNIGNGVTILAKRGANKIVVNGNLTMGQNVHFVAEEGATLEVELRKDSIIFDNATFDNSVLAGYAQNVSVSGCAFENNAAFEYRQGSAAVQNCTFSDAQLLGDVSTQSTSRTNMMLEVANCTFDNENIDCSIGLKNVPNYHIQNNTISGSAIGIKIENSGNLIATSQLVENNTISQCSEAGIQTYNSKGTIRKNQVQNNHVGIKFLNMSSFRLLGDSLATGLSSTQCIKDNDSYEIYASKGAFPNPVRYNAIVDNDNLGGWDDALVYYHNPIDRSNEDDSNENPNGSVPANNTITIAHNYWGSGFNAASDLYSYMIGFIYNPTWSPFGSGVPHEPDSILYSSLYNDALGSVSEGNYTQAQQTYQQLITAYPQSAYAAESLKDLLELEALLEGDYNELQTYYRTNEAVVSDSLLLYLGESLANKCNERQGNYPEAITWYENRIENSVYLPDSIFAVIDLGNLYLEMEELGLKSAYTGKLAALKPASRQEHNKKSDYLLSLLPGKNKQTETVAPATLGAQSELTVIPNPFRQSLTLQLSENEKATKVSVYNSTGMLTTTIQAPDIKQLDLSQLQNGLYLLVVETASGNTHTKKIVKTK
ncbi:MAG: T9SS type A sorting domain-containing protein [Lentimicrobiaceae bacterium]|jgi:parallel beta-helix repeat protein|nr:T9SS type A sorting domain-containing protein [Lentimicrobiaceae bacterium]